MESLTEKKVEAKGEKKFQLTERDRKILQYICRNRFVTGGQVFKQFFSKNPNIRDHYRRLRALEKMGFVGVLLGDLGVRLGYALTPKGRNFLISSGEQIPDGLETKVVYRSTYNHDKLLGDLRPIFESSPIISGFHHEAEVRARLAKKYGRKEIQGEGYKVPDGTFKLETSAGAKLQVALELELAEKAISRYRKIFRQLSLSKDFQLIFFITKTEKMKLKLTSILNWVRENDPVVKAWNVKPGFYFCDLNSLLKLGRQAEFEGPSGPFVLAELEKKKARSTV